MNVDPLLVILFGGLGLFLIFNIYRLYQMRDAPWTWDTDDPGWRRYEIINQTKQQRVSGGIKVNDKFVEPGADLSGADLSDVDWGAGSPLFKHMEKALRDLNLSGADLSGANLRSLRLERVNFTGANLTRTRFDGEPFSVLAANFSGANFTDTELRGTFHSCTFERATFTRVSLDGLNMENCNFTGAIFRDTITHGNQTSSLFKRCNFTGSDFQSCTMNSNLVFNWCDFNQANLSRSHLSSTFEWCDWDKADLSYTSGNIRSRTSNDWYNAKLIGSRLTGGLVERAIPSPSLEARLEELAELLKNGTIDQAEHDALRKKILGI